MLEFGDTWLPSSPGVLCVGCPLLSSSMVFPALRD